MRRALRSDLACRLRRAAARAWPLWVLCLFSGCVKRVPGEDTAVVVIARAVHTMDDERPLAEAVAWRAGKLLAVGSRREVLAAAGADAVVERFPESVVVPGLVDAHVELPLPHRVSDEERGHFLKSALERWVQLGLTQVHLVGASLRTLRFLQSYDMLGVVPVRVYVVARDDEELLLGHGPFVGRHTELRAVEVRADSRLAELAARGFQLAGPLEVVSTVDSGGHRVEFPEGEVPERLMSVTAPGQRGTAIGASGERPLEVLAREPDALVRYTRGGAQVARSDERRGQLKPGFDADFVVLSADPLRDEPEVVRAARVQLSVVDGVDVYRAP